MPFHDGELAAQRRAGVHTSGGAIRDHLAEQHRAFFARLPFVIVAARDRGWPVATILHGPPGFVHAPDAHTLRIGAAPDITDPAAPAILRGGQGGLLGIDLATRRRNRANGLLVADRDGVTLDVQQAFGNCPQYIHARRVTVAPGAPEPARRLGGIDDEARAAIARADTFFVGSGARDSGMDVSHRGGPRGFVRLDGDTLTIPDYPGNLYFNTLGNLLLEPRAALLFVDFERGDLLHLQGAVEIIWDGPEVDAVPGAQRVWRVRVHDGWRRPGAGPRLAGIPLT